MRQKVSVIGAGNVGATCAFRIAEMGIADVVLVDIVEGLPQGKGLDMLEATPVLGTDINVVGTNGYEETANSDVVVITSGIARKPGMSRDDLIQTNSKIVEGVTENVSKHSPNGIIIVVCNPLDAMCQMALHVSKFPKHRVFGQSGVLDSARCVLGGHGDSMVPVISLCAVAGVPITDLLPKDKIDEMVKRTINGGAEIVNLLKTGSAFYAPGVASAQMVEAVLLDTKKILPCSTYLEGEYGISGVYSGVPCKLGKDGIEQIIELKLSADELEGLKKSAEAVRSLLPIMGI